MKIHEIFEDPNITKKIRYVIYAAIIILVIIDVFMHRHHVYFFWDNIPGFSAVLGIVTCFVIIYVAKILGKIWLQKKGDYYDD